MRLTFDPDFDSGFWPGPLPPNSPRKAAVGEAWVGPLILLGTLETALGLGGLFPSHSDRTISLAKTVVDQEGFWSKSAEKDPIGVARTLLRWIDWLKFHGWDGQPPPPSANTPRLTDLAKIAPAALPGTPDRLNAVSAALSKRRPDIESIESYEPIDRLLPLWQRIFVKLAARGVSINFSPPPAAPSSSKSDLRRSLSPQFSPAGDGSLILFRPPNPLDAAERVSAWLWSLGDLSDTVVINPDVALDESLRRFGLPVTGAKESVNDGPYLQVLPLVLAMGWDPPDPQRALELLLLPDGPIPGFISRDLRYALQQWPAVGSPDWKEALQAGLDEVADPAQKANIRERLDSIFRPGADIRSAYPASALKLRAQTVKKWAAARRHAPPEPDPDTAERLDEVIAQCGSLERLLDLSGFDALTETQLLKLNTEIADSLRSGRRYVPQAGIASVTTPGAIAGPARRVIWWDFTLESAPDPFSLPLSRSELAALASIGINLTPASELASDHARRRRRDRKSVV
jgi:ATP-dependent helicase/nuclease subunit B